jgi:ubiquinone/menaquinone biosynthesis C-methylase UbiE
VEATTRRTRDAQMAVAERLAARPERLGTLRLQPDFVPPAPVRTTEIHRQPGGYLREEVAGDLSAALTYMGSVDLYRNAKGMGTGAKPGADDMGRWLAGVARKRAPDLQPRAILDMGCGTGEQTLGYKREWPQAEVTGIDCARPFVRLAHALAEGEGLALHFAEMDAGATDFPDASFDLIVSIILFHETSAAQVRRILQESRRLLRPGGLVLHLDVPYQPGRMPLVKHNGEPFWTGFAEMDMAEELKAAGFAAGFAEYEPFGAAAYLVFGGRA